MNPSYTSFGDLLLLAFLERKECLVNKARSTVTAFGSSKEKGETEEMSPTGKAFTINWNRDKFESLNGKIPSLSLKYGDQLYFQTFDKCEYDIEGMPDLNSPPVLHFNLVPDSPKLFTLNYNGNMFFRCPSHPEMCLNVKVMDEDVPPPTECKKKRKECKKKEALEKNFSEEPKKEYVFVRPKKN